MDQLTYLVMFLMLIALVAIVPAIVRKWHIPSVVAIMAVGIAIGPGGFDVLTFVANAMHSHVTGGELYKVVDALGFLGLVFLMALAGLETDLRMLAHEKKAVSLLSCFTFAVPALAGFCVYRLFDSNSLSAWVYASLFASHSIGIVFPVIREMGLMRSRFGISVLSSTVITDVLSLIMLAVCVQIKTMGSPSAKEAGFSLLSRLDLSWMGHTGFIAFFIALIFAFIVAVMFIAPHLWRLVEMLLPEGNETRVTFFLLMVLLIVLVGEVLGINLIVSAFVGGMAVGRMSGFRNPATGLHQRLEAVGFGLMVPFLFLSVGFQTDLMAFVGLGEGQDVARSLWIAGATIVGLVGSKVFSGWIAMRLSGFGNRQGLCAGLMTVPQLSATLAAAAVALNLKLLDETFFNAIVVLSLVTTLPIPTLVRILISRSHVAFDKTYKGHAALTPENMSTSQDDHLNFTV